MKNNAKLKKEWREREIGKCERDQEGIFFLTKSLK